MKDLMYDIEQIPIVKVEKIREEAFRPEKAHPSDSGYDCRLPDNIHLSVGETQLVGLGFRIQLPRGWECQMRNRSGIVANYNVMLALGVGTIDTDYRGEIMVPLYNFGDESQLFKRGTRITQMVFKKIEPVRLIDGDVDGNTERGEGGFGSTGLK
jgi:dUTP pyrophosphatase